MSAAVPVPPSGEAGPDEPLAPPAPVVGPPEVPLLAVPVPVVSPGFGVVLTPVPPGAGEFPPVDPSGVTEPVGAPDPVDWEVPDIPQATGATSAIQGRNDRLCRTSTIGLLDFYGAAPQYRQEPSTYHTE